MAVNKKTGAAFALVLIASFEGYTHRAIIPVPGDPPTACRGHVVTNGQTVFTDAECDMLTRSDLNTVFSAFAEIKAPPEVMGAFGDLCFNIGVARCKKTHLYAYIKAGDFKAACNEFPKFIYAHGKPYSGLIRRRQAERQLCMKGIPQ
jgi:lysozyme